MISIATNTSITLLCVARLASIDFSPALRAGGVGGLSLHAGGTDHISTIFDKISRFDCGELYWREPFGRSDYVMNTQCNLNDIWNEEMYTVNLLLLQVLESSFIFFFFSSDLSWLEHLR
jgi:hypothetical protein